MWDIKQMKDHGRQAFKNNYWPNVAAAFVLNLVTAGSFGAITNQNQSTVTVDGTDVINSMPDEQKLALAGLVTGAVIVTMIISLALRIFVGNPLSVGCYHFFRKNVENQSTKLGTITEGFGDYARVFITLLLRDLIVALFAMLLVVPGIMKMYSYRMVPYILKDHPELAPMDVLRRSEQMMRGNRMQCFKMDLSFIGWYLLGIVTFNLGNVFWTNPYHQNATATLYTALERSYN